MDEFETVAVERGDMVPDQLRTLFDNPDSVRVQGLPCDLPELGSMVVYFGPGARTVPHRHHNGQHLVITDGMGVVADDSGVHIVRAGDVISNPPGTWHWHGATPSTPMAHLTVETPGDFDLNVERRDWADNYAPNLGMG